MNKLGVVLMGTLLGLFATAYASAEPEGTGSPTDKISAAKTAEMRGDLARIHKNYDAAVFDYLTALRTDSRDVALYNKLGIVELKLEDHRSARHYFNLALKIDPQNSIALNNLGAVACTDGKYKSAVHYLKEALALDESDATAHLNMAEAWIGVGETDHAMTEYSRALELDADILSNSADGVIAQIRTPQQRARIAYLIAKAYAKRGNVEGALEYLRRAKDDRFPNLNKVYSDPEFASIVQDPRLAQIVKR